jgi:hypothetical protein
MQEENTITHATTANLQKDIDKLTLEMFMNKDTYRRYVAKTDPKKHAEKEAYKEDLAKYGRTILEITERLMENPDEPITNEINDIFEKYTQVMIRHFKMKEIESANLYNCDKEDDDMMFGNMDPECSVTKKSFWGKTKVMKKY